MDLFHHKINEQINNCINRFPDKIAVKVDDYEMSYRELAAEADQISHAILRHLAVLKLSGKPLNIGVCLNRDKYLIPSVVALLRLGITYIPIPPTLPSKRIKYIADNCEMDLILTTSNLSAHIPDTPLLTLDTIKEKNCCCQALEKNISENPTAYIIYTSGTTGNPKGVSIPYSSLYAFLSVINRPELTNISSDSRIMMFASINFDASIIEIYGSLFYGATMIIASEEVRNDVVLLYDLMINERISYCFLTPSLMSVFPSYDFPDMDTLCVGGEAMIPSVAQRCMGHNYRLLNAYGPTENVVYSTLGHITPDVSPLNIGHTLPTVKGYVFDDHLQPVAVGESGELMLGGAQLASGYVNNPSLTQSSFIPNPIKADAQQYPTLYHTGDLVKLQADGSYLYLGRKDSQIQLHGFRIELGEIKHQIEKCAGVQEAYVRIEEIGSDKQLVAYIQTADGKDQSELIKQEISQFLAPYMVPSLYVFLQQFPLNMNGKIDASRLVNTQLQKMTQNADAVSPEEAILKSVVARVMGFDDINIDVNLIDELGMTSLQIMQATTSLAFTSFYISAKDFIDNKTIRQIAANHAATPCYWYNSPDKHRPVMIIVSGYTSFSFLYTKWVRNIQDHYSIFVIESYHDTMEVMDMDTLTDKYYDMVKSVISEYGCDILTGFCLGGEIALYLAHKIALRDNILPHAIVLDGEVDRGPEYREKTPTFIFPDFTPEINDLRFDQDMTLVETTPDFHYQGRVTSILSKNFNDKFSDVFEDKALSKEYLEFARSYFDRSPAYWKRRYPECELLFVDSNHDTYLLDQPSVSFLTEYFSHLAAQIPNKNQIK